MKENIQSDRMKKIAKTFQETDVWNSKRYKEVARRTATTNYYTIQNYQKQSAELAISLN